MAGSGKNTPLGICGIRFTRTAVTGAPVGGNTAGSVCFTGGVGSMKTTAVYYTGADIAEPDGCGALAVVRKYPDRLKRMDVEIDLLVQSFELRELVTEASLITSGPNIIGVADLVDTACGAATAKHGVIVEAWSEAWQCSAVDPTFPYRRTVLAHAFFTPSDETLAAGANHLILKGFAQPNAAFANGPFNDLTEPAAGWVRAQYKDTVLPTTCDADGGYVTTPSQS